MKTIIISGNEIQFVRMERGYDNQTDDEAAMEIATGKAKELNLSVKSIAEKPDAKYSPGDWEARLE